jgi:hypothetical protein
MPREEVGVVGNSLAGLDGESVEAADGLRDAVADGGPRHNGDLRPPVAVFP